MDDKTKDSEQVQSTTTNHIVIECPQCRTRFSLNALVLDGLSSPQFQCSDCEKVFTVNTHTLQRVSVISNSNPPEYPKSFPQSREDASSSKAVNDWEPLDQSHDATFDEFMDSSKTPGESVRPETSPFTIDPMYEESTPSEAFSVGEALQTTSQTMAHSGWTLGDSSPLSSEGSIDSMAPTEAPFSFDEDFSSSFDSPATEGKTSSLKKSTPEQDENKQSEVASKVDGSFSLDGSISKDVTTTHIEGDFSSFFIESDKRDDGPIQQELPFQLDATEAPETRTAATGSERYREKDTLPVSEPQVFVAPGEMGTNYPGARKRSFWKDPFWLIAPVLALVLIFWGYSKFLHDKHSLIDSLIASTPEVAPAGLLIDDIRLEKLTLHGEEEVILLSGRLKNKTIKTFEEIILESRILVNDVAQEVQRATAFSPLPHTDIKELSSELLKELQTKRAARIQKLEPGQELHFKMILTPGIIEENPVHSTRIYSVEAY